MLSKEDFLAKKKINFDSVFPSISNMIDNMLLDGKNSIDCKILTASVLYNNKEQFIEFIANKYKQAGWTVKREQGYDQRENSSWDYLQFS